MTDIATLARPYAKAAFNYALKTEQVAEWACFLNTINLVVNHSRAARLLANPQLTAQRKVELLSEIADLKIRDEQKQLLQLLAQNQRLLIVPAIYDLFVMYQAEHEKTLDVEVTTAFSISPEQQQKLQAALKIRLQRDVVLNIHIDNTLIGGAVIRAGDFVIDGSVQGRLNKLKQVLEA